MKKMALLMVCALLGISSIAHASDSQLSIGVDRSFVRLDSKSRGAISGEATFRLSGGTQSKISIKLCDLFVNEEGIKELLPLGATPQSPKGIFQIGPYEDVYKPNGDVKSFRVKIFSTGSKPINRLVTGGLKITVDPTPFESQGNTSRALGVALTFVYNPEDPSGVVIKSGIENSRITVSNQQSSSASRLWLPELPFIVSSGPINLKYSQKNVGNIFLVVTDSVSVRRFGESPSAALYQTEIENRLLLPNQVVQKEVAIVDRTITSNREIDPLGWGIYQIRVATTASYSKEEATTAVSEETFVVFPWKQLLLLLLLLLVLIQRWRRSSAKSKDTKLLEVEEVTVPVQQPVKPLRAPTTARKRSPTKRSAKKAPTNKTVKSPVKKSTKNLQ